MIKGIILDIDGVIVGGKPGFNFPIPNQAVINTVKHINQNGIAISLCTAKPGFAISGLVKLLNLDSIHISNGGAEAINHLQGQVIVKHLIDNRSASKFIDMVHNMGLYVEAYTVDEYAIQAGAFCNLTEINITILDTKPKEIASLKNFVKNHEIIKIMPAAFNKQEKQDIEDVMSNFPDLQLQWGANPMYAPTLFGVVTQKGITKKSGAQDISQHTGIPLDQMLGIGDGLSDWEFMQLCKYTGTVTNADDKVKQYIKGRLENGFIGKSVDENGIIDIFQYYKLIDLENRF